MAYNSNPWADDDDAKASSVDPTAGGPSGGQHLGWKAYNKADEAPVFAGDISKVDTSEYDPESCNANAFGVDIFAAQRAAQQPKPAPQQQQYQQPPRQPVQPVQPKASPFGANKPQQKANPAPFGSKPKKEPNYAPNVFGNAQAASGNPSPFGKAPPRAEVFQAERVKGDYAHKWALDIKWDPVDKEITLTVFDEVSGKTWRRLINHQEVHGDVQQEYFRLGTMIQNGSQKYKYPPNGVGAVEVALDNNGATYNFRGHPVS